MSRFIFTRASSRRSCLFSAWVSLLSGLPGAAALRPFLNFSAQSATTLRSTPKSVATPAIELPGAVARRTVSRLNSSVYFLQVRIALS